MICLIENALFVDRRRAGGAGYLVLRTCAARAAYRADQLAVLDQRNAAARRDHPIYGQDIFVVGLLDGVLEDFRRPSKARRRARLVFGDGDRSELRAVHPREGDET